MKVVATIAVYGDFQKHAKSKDDLRIKVFPAGGGTKQYQFQNILREAGYNCDLFCIHDTDIEPED